MGQFNAKTLLKKSVAPFFAGLYQGLGQIVVLHRVIAESKNQRLRNTGIEITEEHLEQLIIFFRKRNYDFISLEELVDYLAVKRKRKFVIFTLDDGYLDNLTNAYPVFKKYKVPFTIYITTNFPDKKAVLWWYLLEDLLLKEQSISFRFQNKSYAFKLQTYSEKEVAFNYLRELIKSQEEENQLALIDSLFSINGIPLYQKVEELALNWDQIIQLNNDPLVSIGAHTVSHPSFKAISDDQILKEINESIQILESKLDATIKHFAYPYGSAVEVGEREVKLLSKTKIKTATTGRVGNVMREHINHLHALPRLYIGSATTELELNNFISGKTSFIKGVKERIITV